MKRFSFALLMLFFVFASYADEEVLGAHCGTRGNMWGTIASEVFIPDFFPPENPLLRALLIGNKIIDLGMCESNFTPAHLGSSCIEHDQCYETLGAQKENCDQDLKAGWIDSCEESYRGLSGFVCRQACKLAVNVMYTAMRFQSGGFCPSCEAFAKGQKRARS